MQNPRSEMVPMGENRTPAAPQPYPYLRLAFLNAQPLPQGTGQHVDLGPVPDADFADTLAAELKTGLDALVIGAGGSNPPAETHSPTGSAAPNDAPATINDRALEALIACETASVPTALLAQTEGDMTSSVSAVVSHAVTFSPVLFEQLRARFGPERALLLEEAVDPREALLGGADPEQAAGEKLPADHLSPERITQRRELVAQRSPKGQADRLVEFLGLPVEPEPLVTAVLISRHAQNLPHTLANLKRQTYSRIDPLLVIDPVYENKARELTAEWDLPLRIVVANPRSTPADKLNLGVQHAHGDMVAVIEETGFYGAQYLTDQVQALQYSGADVVGKASWYTWDAEKNIPVLHAGSRQWRTDQLPATGTLVFRRETARALGFFRRGKSVNGTFAERLRAAGGTVLSTHAVDTVLLKGKQTLQDIPASVLESEAVLPTGSGREES